MAASFTLLRFPGTPAMDCVFIDIRDGVICVEKPSDVDSYITDFSRLGSDFTLQQPETIELLQEETERRTGSD
jgi:hypothetical protein